MYEKLIRKPANKSIKPGQDPLPPWNPATIKSHLLLHTKDMRTRRSSLLYYYGASAQYIAKNMILCTNMNVSPGETPPPSSLRINKEAVKAVKDLTDAMVKMLKIPQKDLDRDSMTTDDLFRSVQKSAIIDPTRKTIKTGNTAVGLDYYFHTSVLRLRSKGQEGSGMQDGSDDGSLTLAGSSSDDHSGIVIY